MEAEIESLLKSLESLKHDASDESKKTLGVLKNNAENALKHSRRWQRQRWRTGALARIRGWR